MWLSRFVIGFSCWLFGVNQILLFQRLYFRRLLSLNELMYLSLTGVIYQYSQISLLAVITEIGQKWYVPMIGLLLCAVSLSMFLERKTRMKFSESLTCLVLGQLCGARLIEVFLLHKMNNRTQKVTAMIMYTCFMCGCWLSLLALVIGFAQDRLFQVLDRSAIGSVILTVIFVMLPSFRQIYVYFLNSPLNVTVCATEKGIDCLDGTISEFVNSISCCVKSEYIGRVLSWWIHCDLVMKVEIQIEIEQPTLQNEPIVQGNDDEDAGQIIESIYDTDRISFAALKVQITNHKILLSILKSLHSFSILPILLIYMDRKTHKQAINSLSQNSFLCCNLASDSNLIVEYAHFKNYCAYLRATQMTLLALNQTIMRFLPINPLFVYYDLHDQ